MVREWIKNTNREIAQCSWRRVKRVDNEEPLHCSQSVSEWSSANFAAVSQWSGRSFRWWLSSYPPRARRSVARWPLIRASRSFTKDCGTVGEDAAGSLNATVNKTSHLNFLSLSRSLSCLSALLLSSAVSLSIFHTPHMSSCVNKRMTDRSVFNSLYSACERILIHHHHHHQNTLSLLKSHRGLCSYCHTKGGILSLLYTQSVHVFTWESFQRWKWRKNFGNISKWM